MSELLQPAAPTLTAGRSSIRSWPVWLFSIAFVLGLASFASLILEVRHSWHEETFAWFEGVSIWPTEVVRSVAAVVAVYSVVLSQKRLFEMKQAIAERFQFLPPTDSLAYPTPGWRRQWLRALLIGRANESWGYIVIRFVWSRLARLARGRLPCARQPATVWTKYLWLTPGVHYRGADDSLIEQEAALWTNYCRVSAPPVRFWRIVGFMSVYFTIFLCVAWLDGMPHVPARGDASRALDQGILVAAVFAYCYLLFFVFDTTLLAASFIAHLQQFIGAETKLPDSRAIHLINDLTEVVSGLIYLPFSVLFMLIISRNRLFDAWDWPPLLLGVFGSGLVLIVISALLLQQKSRVAKNRALDHLDEAIAGQLEKIAAHAAGAPPNLVAREKLLRELRAQTESFNGVVFQRWSSNPIFRAVLIPLGGVGSLQILERFVETF